MTPLAKGVELFNAHHFWHAHEAWEEIWLTSSGGEKTFLQGLIQLAAAYHHVQRGTFRGAIRLFDAAFAKLDPFPPGYAGVDRANVIEVARGHRTRISAGEKIDAREYAKLTLDGG
ncbi:MAG: hypothetical protein DMF56_06990 [Acidobacteria bacterium]|nr:MAG: hypothetical protein DMF56_06990 [Acidobacteriota bacterium]